MEKTIIGITGMPGTGKAIASSVAMELGLPVLIMGDVIRDEAKNRGIAPTGINLGRLMIELRRKEGKGVVARKLLSRIESSKKGIIVIEGIRSLEEVKEFRKFYKVIIFGIHSSPDQRFIRLKRRGRSDDPKKWDEFTKRDERELEVGVGSAIALSDIMIINDSTINRFKNEANRILKSLISVRPKD